MTDDPKTRLNALLAAGFGGTPPKVRAYSI